MPTPEQRRLVTIMAGMGIPEEQQVLTLLNPYSNKPIDAKTLRKHFRTELDQGFVQANTKVGAALFTNATTGTDQYPGGVPVAQIFWLKCRARWQQNPERNPQPPMEIDVTPPAANKETAKLLAFLLAKGAADT